MNNKTVEMTVAEFRKNVKVALDFAVQGGVVIIDRMGQKFMLTNIPHDVNIEVGTLKTARVADKLILMDGVNPLTKVDLTGKSEKIIEQYTPPDGKPFAISIKNNSEAKASNSTDGFVEAGVDPSGELHCCKAAKPCKHWQWDGNQVAWVNSLSGRSKEA